MGCARGCVCAWVCACTGPMGMWFLTAHQPGCVWCASGEGTEICQGLVIPAQGKVNRPQWRASGKEEPCAHWAGDPGLVHPSQDGSGKVSFLLRAWRTQAST